MNETIIRHFAAAAVAAVSWGGAYGADFRFSTQGMDFELTFMSPSVVRVVKHPSGITPSGNSLAVVKTPEEVEAGIKSGDRTTVITTDSLIVEIDRKSGALDFYNRGGVHLLKDKDYGTSFTPAWDGQRNNHIVRHSFLLDSDEPVFGIGQVSDGKWNRRGTSYRMENVNMYTYTPLFVSPTKGYGVFWDNYSIGDFKDNPQDLSFEGWGDSSDYYFIYGSTPEGVTSGIRDLTGQAPMLPLWAYGFFQSRERYSSQDELVATFKKFRDLKVPIDVIIQDWRYWPQHNGSDSLWNCHAFDSIRYPNPARMGRNIHDMNGKFLIVTWPGFGPKSETYGRLDEKGHMINFYTFPGCGTRPYDSFSAEARDIFWDSLDKGVYSVACNDGWWLDSTEPDVWEKKPGDYDSPTSAGAFKTVKNAYSLMQNRGIYEHQRAKDDSRRVVTLTRSGYVGQQRYGANTWSGDVDSRWEVLHDQIPAALNYASIGIPYWNSDIGGFYANMWREKGGNDCDEWRELYTRWMQFGAFCPMMRSHGTGLPREIWQFGERGTPVFDAQERMIKLRYRMLPYNYSTAWDVTSGAGLFMRPLYMDFAGDSSAVMTGTQYMYGRNFLVAPVTEYKAREWDVYLPEGTDWWNFWTNTLHSGGQTVKTPAAFDEIPLYVRAGSIVPWGPEVQYSSEKPWNNLEIRIYPGADGEFTLYEDAGDGYAYEKGERSTIKMIWDDKARTLTIGRREGSYPGMLRNRKFRIVMMGEGVAGGDTPHGAAKTVSYNGKPHKVML